ncbi:MAG TPA: hypothetical protein VFK89_03305 [Actinomycetota bacterium]|nr:hypothetical protein [Actinomycetota bacterium]
MKKIVAVVVLALLALAPTAGAATFTDPDDMTSPLDIRKLTYTDEGHQVATFVVVTDDNWRCSYIQPGLTSVKWLFDGRNDGDVDLVGKTRCLNPAGPGRDLELFLSGRDTGNSYEPVPIKRPNRHTMKVTFSFDLVELRGPHASMFMKVKDGAAEGCTSAHKCTERAPDSGKWQLF